MAVQNGFLCFLIKNSICIFFPVSDYDIYWWGAYNLSEKLTILGVASGLILISLCRDHIHNFLSGCTLQGKVSRALWSTNPAGRGWGVGVGHGLEEALLGLEEGAKC